MSIFGVEQVLWDVSRDKSCADAFRAGSGAFLARYRVDTAEAAAVEGMDVGLLAARGVNPMLLMQAWNTLIGPDAIGEYLSRMKGGDNG
jgi:hypothetical protein